MGQKINPIGFRLGINRGWDSTWFAKKKDFGKYLIEDFKIRNYIKKNITNSGVSEIIIDKYNLAIPLNELYFKKYQKYIFKNIGIPKINVNNVFENNNKANIIIHIYLE